jgi:hypothetical protein
VLCCLDVHLPRERLRGALKRVIIYSLIKVPLQRYFDASAFIWRGI